MSTKLVDYYKNSVPGHSGTPAYKIGSPLKLTEMKSMQLSPPAKALVFIPSIHSSCNFTCCK
ncbi:hypothetical protein [Paraflavitalea soli]|uniref:hypothetical protein n=1 Tax=Paraflavitalea soli TaxID=2315862 RepID=UPI0013C4EA73|nr:hypothetical protein [Paraflavitalea soli]